MTSEREKEQNELQPNNITNTNRVFRSEEHELTLTLEQKAALERQDTRLVSSFRTDKFDKESKKTLGYIL